jgi:DNA-binding winged helix-turn-helix (wHTH) protein/predicted ATPase
MLADPQFRFDAYRLEVRNEQLWCGAQAIRLTAKAFCVLRYLVEHAGQLVTKDALFRAVWPETVVSEGVLTNCIGELRKALGDAAQAPRFIATVHRRGYRFIAPVTLIGPSEPTAYAASAAVPISPAPPPLLVGREAEVQALRQLLEQALQGQRRVVFVTGEAGIGKTTVVDAFLSTMTGAAPSWVAWGQCIAHYGAGEAYLPVLDALGRLCRTPGHECLVALLGQYAPTWVVQMPALLSPAALERMQRNVLGANRERMLRELAEALEVVTAEQPLVLVLEDLHWSDHATLDLIAWLARRRESARLLLLGTYRPVDVLVQGHPLQALKQDLALHRQCVELRLEGLSEAAVATYLGARFPGCLLPAGLVRVLHRRTEGQPLFMVQAVDAWVQQGWVTEVVGEWVMQVGVDAVETGVPESVRQMILQQFDGLSPGEQGVLEAASVLGVEFSTAAVAAGVESTMEHVEEWCEARVRRGQFLRGSGVEEWPDGTVAGRYAFLHTLHQQVVYQQLPMGGRRQFHRSIGVREETGYGERANEVAAALALHFERGGDHSRAVRYRQQAADTALQRHAYREAIAHLTTALAHLQTLPNPVERTQHELPVQLTLALAYGATAGWGAPETVQAYNRADELCRQVQDPAQRLRVLRGLSGVYTVRAELWQARELCEEYLRLARASQEPGLLLDGHQHLGQTLYWCGDFAAAWAHLEQAIALSALPRPHAMPRVSPYDPGVGGHSYAALVLWALGYPEQALHQGRAGLTLAQELSHPFSLAWALHFTALLHCHRRDIQEAGDWSVQVLTLAHEQGFAQRVATGTTLQGWVLAVQGQHAEGMARLRQGLAAYRATGAEVGRTYFLAFLAEACGRAGEIEEGLAVLTEVLAWVDKYGEYFHEAELYRLKGELLLAHTLAHPGEAETCFQQALDIARRRQARSLELRAATSLARLWQQQGKRTKAYELLAPVYHWFTEGFDTADLREAAALLNALTRREAVSARHSTGESGAITLR